MILRQEKSGLILKDVKHGVGANSIDPRTGNYVEGRNGMGWDEICFVTEIPRDSGVSCRIQRH